MKFGDFDADLRWLEWFVPGFYGGIRLTRLRLTPVGVIGTVWRMGIAVFGVRDAAKWCRCRRVVSIWETRGAEFKNEVMASSAQIDTGWRDWHRLEDGHCGFWAMRCRQVVPMLPRCVDHAQLGS